MRGSPETTTRFGTTIPNSVENTIPVPVGEEALVNITHRLVNIMAFEARKRKSPALIPVAPPKRPISG